MTNRENRCDVEVIDLPLILNPSHSIIGDVRRYMEKEATNRNKKSIKEIIFMVYDMELFFVEDLKVGLFLYFHSIN